MFTMDAASPNVRDHPAKVHLLRVKGVHTAAGKQQGMSVQNMLRLSTSVLLGNDYISPTKDSYTINNCPVWEINGTPLRMIDPEKSGKYLGLEINPWVGISKPELEKDLSEWLDRIGKASLKPLQKVDILKGYAIPRMIYKADQAEVKASYLEALDLMIRSNVKEWLHLPPCTCDAILYSCDVCDDILYLSTTDLINGKCYCIC